MQSKILAALLFICEKSTLHQICYLKAIVTIFCGLSLMANYLVSYLMYFYAYVISPPRTLVEKH